MKVRKMLLREETEKVLHTKSNGDKLVVAASGDGYTAFTRDNVRIVHISADTDAAAVAEFSKKEPKYESMNEDYLDSAEFRIQRYEDDIPELFHRVHDGYMNGMVNAKAYADVLAKIYSVLEELDYVDESLKESYMDTHEGVAHVDTLDLMAALKSVVKEYGHMELVTPLYCELHDDEHGRRLELNKAVDEGLVPDKIVPDKIGGDINLNLDGSHSSVGFLGGTATNTNNGEEGDHDASNAHNEDLNEAMSKSALAGIFGTLGDAYGKIMLNSEQADKILAACGKEPQGKDATFDEILSVAQDVIASAPLAATAIVSLAEVVFDVLMWAVTAGLIVLPLDGPVGECIIGLLAAIPVAPIVGAIVALPAAGATRLIQLARKALRNKNDVEKVEKAAEEAGIETLDKTNEDIDDDFMDAENMDMSEFDSHQGKLEDIEFVMTEYIADSMLIEFVKKVDATTWLVGVEDEVVTVKFDPSWSEYVYTIEGRGPYSHSSYEYISRDVYDFVMSQRTGDEYDDDFDDLSSFNECSDVKRADALYGVEGREDLVEAVYTDTSGIMGVAGETYTTAELRKIWNDNHNDDPSMVKYNGDYDKWVSDTLAQMSRNDDVDEAFDMSRGPDLGKLSWQVASYLDVDALGEDKWIEFICDDPRDTTGGKKSMRFEAIGEDAHMYGFIRTNGDAVDVQFRNGSEAVCHSAEEVARFIAGEFGISL